MPSGTHHAAAGRCVVETSPACLEAALRTSAAVGRRSWPLLSHWPVAATDQAATATCAGQDTLALHCAKGSAKRLQRWTGNRLTQQGMQGIAALNPLHCGGHLVWDGPEVGSHSFEHHGPRL